MSSSKFPEKSPQDEVVVGRTVTEEVDLEKVHEAAHEDIGWALYEEALAMDPDERDAIAKKVLKKLDWILLPMMSYVYFVNFLDKQTLNYANAYTLHDDLHLKGNQYSWIASALNFGFVIFTYPANICLQKLPIGRFVSCNLMVSGVLLLSVLGVKSFGSMMVIRILQGGAECCVGPAWLLLGSMFWTREEQPLRMSIWLGFNGIALIIGAGVAFLLGKTETTIPAWRLIYVVLGANSFIFGLISFFVLPSDPSRCVFFTREEKVVSVWRVRNNRTGIKHQTLRPHQAKEAAKDPKVYLMAFTALCLGILNGSITNFASSILKSFGLSSLKVNLYQMPAGLFEFIFCCVAGFVTSRYKNTLVITIIIGMIPGMGGMIGLSVISVVKENLFRLVGCAWVQGIFAVSVVLSWNLVSSNIAGHTKRSTVLSVIFTFSSAGNIIGPFLFLPSEAPRYISALRALIGFYAGVIALTSGIGYLMWRDNRKRSGMYELHSMDGDEDGFADRTDKENKAFQYRL